eukprot:CAMPEP_0184521282 /NCGR_PEP_ID=MMETSP0198_2-20121128/7623_1 /TAXON_ID=1112570 /ORGANISM="Thraustochytrium sp., Strain LLF1b" /LENGTH=123 /DNA_ID=CAMNT_0026911947 /DNA_START=115 /DNA_END=483 /DNA_ORIENTATION=-
MSCVSTPSSEGGLSSEDILILLTEAEASWGSFNVDMESGGRSVTVREWGLPWVITESRGRPGGDVTDLEAGRPVATESDPRRVLDEGGEPRFAQAISSVGSTGGTSRFKCILLPDRSRSAPAW